MNWWESDNKTMLGFRKKLFTDAKFRKRFAANPQAALTEAGFKVPANAKIPAVNAKTLESRVTGIKMILGRHSQNLWTKGGSGKLVNAGINMRKLTGFSASLIDFRGKIGPVATATGSKIDI